ncbi:hypothetical protein TIFTF001_023244 [Ficus carica]|uniref:Uncharacterized protein n=1 Tax=Ficus carica TaxID=3494 RepID=A0AA88DG47_FICCA|nr:hypothetical protein TIFTF001_023244 [Ficus carica]
MRHHDHSNHAVAEAQSWEKKTTTPATTAPASGSSSTSQSPPLPSPMLRGSLDL